MEPKDKAVLQLIHFENKKHSTRFQFDMKDPSDPCPLPNSAWSAFSAYLPKPFAVKAKRIRVTIEVME